MDRQLQRRSNDLRLQEMTPEQIQQNSGSKSPMEVFAQQIEAMLSQDERQKLDAEIDSNMSEGEMQALGEKIDKMSDNEIDKMTGKVVREGYKYYYPYYSLYRRYYNPFLYRGGPYYRRFHRPYGYRGYW